MNTTHFKGLNRAAQVLFALVIMVACDTDPKVETDVYACNNLLLNTHPQTTDFDNFLTEQVADGLPGLAMLIHTPEGFYTGAAGVADIPNGVSLEPCHLHRVGSISKQFTATVILSLWQDGLFDLDDHIWSEESGDILRNIANAQELTWRHLLNHSSGIPDVYEIDFWWDYYDDPKRVKSATQELDMIRSQEAEFPAGSVQDYSNSNYILLQVLAERITSQSFDELLRERIFMPLGLTETYFSSRGDRPANAVRGYSDEYGNGYLRDVTEHSFGTANGTGGVYSTLWDIFKFQQSFFDGSETWEQELIDAMIAPSTIDFLNPEDWEYDGESRISRIANIGLGWFELETEIGPAFGHNGGLMGRKARAWYFPERRSHIIYFINGDGGKIDDLSRPLFRIHMIDLLDD